MFIPRIITDLFPGIGLRSRLLTLVLWVPSFVRININSFTTRDPQSLHPPSIGSLTSDEYSVHQRKTLRKGVGESFTYFFEGSLCRRIITLDTSVDVPKFRVVVGNDHLTHLTGVNSVNQRDIESKEQTLDHHYQYEFIIPPTPRITKSYISYICTGTV